MIGKKKCKILKEIRQRIADENDIPYVTRECSYQGECSGTCPKCESELRYLEQQLALRQSLGKRVAVAGLCATMALAVSGCGPRGGDTVQLTGDVPMETPGWEEPETGEVDIDEGRDHPDFKLSGTPTPAPITEPEEEEEPFELMGDVVYEPEQGEEEVHYGP